MPPIIFRQLFEKESSTYTYLLGCPVDNVCVLIDPVVETVDRDLKLVDDLGLTLKLAINTHCHADHITGTGEIKKRRKGVLSGISSASGARADVLYLPNDVIEVGETVKLKVLATPGHTSGCVSFYTTSGECARVFTGDAVLVRGCGRTDFQGGSSDELYDSVHTQIFSLPGDTAIYPAHDYRGHTSSTVAEEKACNPRLNKSKEDFAVIMQGLNLPYPKKIDIAMPANLMCGIQE